MNSNKSAYADQATRYYRQGVMERPSPSPLPLADAPLQYTPPPPARRFVLRRLLIGLLLLVLLLLGVTLLALGVTVYQGETIAPPVELLGNPIGGRSRAAAIVSVAKSWDQRAVTLAHEGEIWLLHPSELGVTLDVAASVEGAHALGRTPAAWQSWWQTGQMSAAPVWQLDPAVAEAALQELAPQLAVPAQDAAVLVENGRLRTLPAQAGQSLNVAATLDYFITNGSMVILDGRLPLQIETIPPTVTDVSAEAAAAEALLGQRVTIEAYDPVRDEAISWELSPAVWGAWLRLQAAEGGVDWSLDAEAAEAFFAARSDVLGADRYLDGAAALSELQAAIETRAETIQLRIYHTAVTHFVQPGETLASIGRRYGIPYPWIQEANPGLQGTLAVGQPLVIPSPDELLPYPVVDGKRVVVSISEQRVRVYEAGALKWDWPASTGIPSSPTAPGVFQVQTHESNAYAANWDLWMPHFMGIYQPAPTIGFMNGFHGFPTRDGANLLWTNNLGRPVTYGCILLANEQALELYSWAEQGTIVEILP